MDFQDNVPIYLQIEKYLYRQIALGKIKAGEKIPSVRQLAVELTVNVNTVQRAIAEMNREGILEAKRGLGSFITTDKELIESKRMELVKDTIKEFLESCQQLGLDKEEAEKVLRDYIENDKK